MKFRLYILLKYIVSNCAFLGCKRKKFGISLYKWCPLAKKGRYKRKYYVYKNHGIRKCIALFL